MFGSDSGDAYFEITMPYFIFTIENWDFWSGLPFTYSGCDTGVTGLSPVFTIDKSEMSESGTR